MLNQQKNQFIQNQKQFTDKLARQKQFKEDIKSLKTEKEKINYWIKIEAPSRLRESLERLGINFKQITKSDLE